MKIYAVILPDYESPSHQCYCLTKERALIEKEKYDQELINERNRTNEFWIEEGKPDMQWFLKKDDMHVIHEIEVLE